jgi:hypothetical protein
MIRSGRYARSGSALLLAWVVVLNGCNAQSEEMNSLQREDAERQALIDAMKSHPAFNEAENGAATGKPIDVPTAVPPKAKGSADHHDHAPK